MKVKDLLTTLGNCNPEADVVVYNLTLEQLEKLTGFVISDDQVEIIYEYEATMSKEDMDINEALMNARML